MLSADAVLTQNARSSKHKACFCKRDFKLATKIILDKTKLILTEPFLSAISNGSAKKPEHKTLKIILDESKLVQEVS